MKFVGSQTVTYLEEVCSRIDPVRFGKEGGKYKGKRKEQLCPLPRAPTNHYSAYSTFQGQITSMFKILVFLLVKSTVRAIWRGHFIHRRSSINPSMNCDEFLDNAPSSTSFQFCHASISHLIKKKERNIYFMLSSEHLKYFTSYFPVPRLFHDGMPSNWILKL